MLEPSKQVEAPDEATAETGLADRFATSACLSPEREHGARTLREAGHHARVLGA